MAERRKLRPARYITVRASAACEAENRELRAALTEALYKLAALRGQLTPEPSEQPTEGA